VCRGRDGQQQYWFHHFGGHDGWSDRHDWFERHDEHLGCFDWGFDLDPGWV
jgi:hypothetical protein